MPCFFMLLPVLGPRPSLPFMPIYRLKVVFVLFCSDHLTMMELRVELRAALPGQLWTEGWKPHCCSFRALGSPHPHWAEEHTAASSGGPGPGQGQKRKGHSRGGIGGLCGGGLFY